MRCKYCGKELENNAMFCSMCGERTGVGMDATASMKKIALPSKIIKGKSPVKSLANTEKLIYSTQYIEIRYKGIKNIPGTTKLAALFEYYNRHELNITPVATMIKVNNQFTISQNGERWILDSQFSEPDFPTTILPNSKLICWTFIGDTEVTGVKIKDIKHLMVNLGYVFNNIYGFNEVKTGFIVI